METVLQKILSPLLQSVSKITSAQCKAFNLEENIPDHVTILFGLLAVLVALAAHKLSKHVPIQESLISLVFGGLLGILGCYVYLGEFTESVESWIFAEEPLLFLYLTLPPVLWESACSVDWFVFRRSLVPVILLAFVMVFMETFATAGFLYGINQFSFMEACMFGAIVSATDPVAVVAIMKKANAPEWLFTLIEGESLLNDGSGFTLFVIFLNGLNPDGADPTVGSVLAEVCKQSFGGLGIGLAFGLATVLIYRRIHNDIHFEISFSVIIAFLSFYVAQSPAQVSGAIAVVVTGVHMAAIGNTYVTPHVHEEMESFWSTLSFITNCVIFVYSGYLAITTIFASWGVYVHAKDVGIMFAIYFFLQGIRFVCLLILWPILGIKRTSETPSRRFFGYGLTFKQVIFLSLCGIRGSVSLVLSEIVQRTAYIDSTTRAKVALWSSGVTCLSLLINGSLAGIIAKGLGILDKSTARLELFDDAVQNLIKQTNQEITRASSDDRFVQVDWKWVRDAISRANMEVKKAAAEYEDENTISADFHQSYSSLTGTRNIRDLFFQKRVESEAPENYKADSDEEYMVGHVLGESSALNDITRLQTTLDLSELAREQRKKVLQGIRSIAFRDHQQALFRPRPFRVLKEVVSLNIDDTSTPLNLFDLVEKATRKKKIEKKIRSYLSRSKMFRGITRYLVFREYEVMCEVTVQLFKGFRSILSSHIRTTKQSRMRDSIVIDEVRKELLKCIKYLSEIEMIAIEVIQSILTHKAAIHIINKQRSFIEESLEIGEIDEAEANLLNSKIDMAFLYVQRHQHGIIKPKSCEKVLAELFPGLTEDEIKHIKSLGKVKYYEGPTVIAEAGYVPNFIVIPVMGITGYESNVKRLLHYRDWRTSFSLRQENDDLDEEGFRHLVQNLDMFQSSGTVNLAWAVLTQSKLPESFIIESREAEIFIMESQRIKEVMAAIPAFKKRLCKYAAQNFSQLLSKTADRNFVYDGAGHFDEVCSIYEVLTEIARHVRANGVVHNLEHGIKTCRPQCAVLIQGGLIVPKDGKKTEAHGMSDGELSDLISAEQTMVELTAPCLISEIPRDSVAAEGQECIYISIEIDTVLGLIEMDAKKHRREE